MVKVGVVEQCTSRPCWSKPNENKSLFPPSFELGTFRVLGERDNHYTMETAATPRQRGFLKKISKEAMHVCQKAETSLCESSYDRSYGQKEEGFQIRKLLVSSRTNF